LQAASARAIMASISTRNTELGGDVTDCMPRTSSQTSEHGGCRHQPRRSSKHDHAIEISCSTRGSACPVGYRTAP
jgi:hypothetical protein